MPENNHEELAAIQRAIGSFDTSIKTLTSQSGDQYDKIAALTTAFGELTTSVTLLTERLGTLAEEHEETVMPAVKVMQQLRAKGQGLLIGVALASATGGAGLIAGMMKWFGNGG